MEFFVEILEGIEFTVDIYTSKLLEELSLISNNYFFAEVESPRYRHHLTLKGVRERVMGFI